MAGWSFYIGKEGKRKQLECPSWSKGVDLRSSVFSHSWVRTPPLAFLLFKNKQMRNGGRMCGNIGVE